MTNQKPIYTLVEGEPFNTSTKRVVPVVSWWTGTVAEFVDHMNEPEPYSEEPDVPYVFSLDG